MSRSKRTSTAFPRPLPPKKTKLDISIISAGGSARSSNVQLPKTTNNGQHQLPKTTTHNKFEPNPFAGDMWGDDDDELIMLATQVADKVETFGQDIIVNAMDITSFDHFRPTTIGGSSTQMPDDIEEDANLLRDLLFANEIDDAINEQAAAVPVTSKESEDMFAPRQSADPTNKPSIAGNQQQQQHNNMGGCGSDRRPQNEHFQRNVSAAKDAQLKHLSKQLDDTKREVAQLLLEQKGLQERCQTKDGEIAMIRIDLGQQKKIQSTLRQERLDEMEKLKQEQMAKVKQLEMANKTQLNSLHFKHMEALKSSHQNQLVKPAAAVVPELSEAEICSRFALQMTICPVRPVRHIDAEVFVSSDHRFIYQQPLQQLRTVQSYIGQMLQNDLTTPVCPSFSSEALKMISEISLIAFKCIEQIHTDLLADAGKPTDAPDLYQKFIYEYGCEERQQLRASLHVASVYQMEKMFDKEKIHLERRLLAVVANVGYFSNYFCNSLLATSNFSRSFCSLLIESLQMIGSMKSWSQYAGFLEAISFMLRQIGDAYKPSDANDTIICQLLQSLLFCRPTGRALLHIAIFLCGQSRNNPALMQLLCSRCNHQIAFNRKVEKLLFKMKTCPILMFSVLLQIEFTGNYQLVQSPVRRKIGYTKDQTLLLDITEYALKLIDNCTRIPVHWMVASPANGSDGPRLCYAHLVCALIKCLYLCIKRWIDDPLRLSSGERERVGQLASSTILFVHDHFVTNLNDIVLDTGGVEVRQQLHTLFRWILNRKSLLRMSLAHDRAIYNLNSLCRIRHMIEPLRCSEKDEDDAEDEDCGVEIENDVEIVDLWKNIFKKFL